MLETATEPQKLVITCRFIQHDQWLTTHVQPAWTIRQLKLWLVHRLFGISIPARVFTTPQQTGLQAERPPSPITFAPDPRHRPASPIIFAAPQKSGFYGSVGGGATGGREDDGGNARRRSRVSGFFSDTDEDLLSDSESGFSSMGGGGVKGKGKGRMEEIRIETGPPSSTGVIPGGRIGPSHATISDTESIPGPGIIASPTKISGYTPAEADRYPGGINPNHWTLTRYSTGQVLQDEEHISWYDIAEFEIIELHGLSFPSTHTLYEYQICHLWNPERHRERERLRKKLKKRFEAEAARAAKDKDKDKDKDGGTHATALAAKRATLQAQILKAMNLNSGAGANVGVVEYYGAKLAATRVELTLTRIPRSIDLYVQPYWEGWVRTLRIVWRGDWNDIAFSGATAGHSLPVHVHPSGSAVTVVGGSGSGGNVLADPFKYGAYSAAGATLSAMATGMYHGSVLEKGPGSGGGSGGQRIVRVEWRERWIRIQNGTLAVLKDREDEDATHILPLKNILSLTNTQHLVRYLSYTGFNPPLDHPSVNPDILIPALNLPIQRPVMPTGHSSHYANAHSHSNTSSSGNSKSKSSSNHAYPSSDDSDSPHHHTTHHHHQGHGHGHHSSISGGLSSALGGGLVGGGGGGGGGGKDHHSSGGFNFHFPSYTYLHAHMKARELTPLVGSRFDPTYLPITIEEQKASGLRVVCLQFRKQGPSSGTGTGATTPGGGLGVGKESREGMRPSTSSSGHHRPEDITEREKARRRGEKERNADIDPITLALEDMKERAGEWGGIRSDNVLWKCPDKLRREPPYLIRARTRMAKLRSSARYGSRGGGVGGGDGRQSMKSSGGRSSAFRSGGSSPHHHHHHRGATTPRPSSSSGITKKERYYERERRHRHHRTRTTSAHDGGEVDLHGIIAAQIIAGHYPNSSKHIQEERERREKKERRKREKEIEKERARHEKELRGKGKGKEKEKERELAANLVESGFVSTGGGAGKDEKEKDWNLGSLNVAFWNWGKKKKAKKEKMEKQRARQLGAGFSFDNNDTNYNNESSSNIGFATPTSASAYASTSTVQLSSHLGSRGQRGFSSASMTTIGTGVSASTVTTSTGPSGGSSTVVGGSSLEAGGSGNVVEGLGGGVGAPSSDDDDGDEDGQIEFAQYVRSETSAANTTEDDDDEEEEDDDEDDEEEEEEEEEGVEEEDDQDVNEPYPDDVPENPPVVEEEEGEDDWIEYANQPSTTSTDDTPRGERRSQASRTTTKTSNALNSTEVPKVVVQIAVDKRVETEANDVVEGHKPNTVVFGGRSIIPSPRAMIPPTSFPSASKAISIDTNVTSGEVKAQGQQVLKKQPSQRLIGQLHSSDEEKGEEVAEQGDEDEELSSPVFAPPPNFRRTVRIKSPVPSSYPPRSISSHGSNASFDGTLRGEEEEEEYDFDDDLDFEDEYLGHRRIGYRYGLYGNEERRRRAEQLEEQREREAARIKELRELEEKEREEMEKEKEKEKEKERERERRERRRKEEEGEWVCLDIGNDFAFQSFLRIVHQHCPHPMKSTFMDRTMGGPLNDAPPPPQKLPQPLMTNAYSESASNSVEPSSPSIKSHHSSSQSQPDVQPLIESVLEATDASGHPSIPNSPTSLHSHQPTSCRASTMSPLPQQASVPTSPSAPSIPAASSPPPYPLPPSPSPSEEDGTTTEADEVMDSEAEYVAPLPGYGDPRFVYPSRTFATPPYPEWRLNVMRKAQQAGMGDVGRAMEFIYWGREDPVIANASGALNELERMGNRWGSRGGVPGFPSAVEKGTKEKKRESGWSDNVSSLGTIGPQTVGSGGTVKGVQVSPQEQRKRLSLGGKALRSPRSTSSVRGAILEAEREGGESGNESSGENSDGSVGGNTSTSDAEKPSRSPNVTGVSSIANRLSRWSDDDEEYASEPEWTAWHIDIRRQSKRQYAIQARRAANSTLGVSGELDLGIPVDPADDMRKYLKNRYEMEPSAKITQGVKPVEDTSASVSVSTSLTGSRSAGQISSAATSVMGTSPPSRMGSDTLGPHHPRTSSQQYPTLHHSASLHTGLRKGAQDTPLRRPSMPSLNLHLEKEKERAKSKFWNITGFSGSDEFKSPTTASSGWFSRKEVREKGMISPSGSASQPVSASGSVGRTGNALLKGGLLRKKDSGDVTRDREREQEKERERMKMYANDGETKRGPRPQLRVATSSSAALSSPAAPDPFKSPEQVRSPTFAPQRFVRRMRSDASILSTRAADTDPETSSPPQGKRKKGTVVKLLNSSIDFIDGK